MHYNPALDGIRALSILAVVCFHCLVPWAGGGFLGVDVFFVVSGYLITSLLASEHAHGGIAVGRFYIRRAVRLYPTLLLMLAAYVGLAPVLWPADDRWLNSALAALYLTDYSLAFWKLPRSPSTVGHTWSLAVEEQFYLLWPLVLPFILRARRPVAWLVAAFLVVTAWRYGGALRWGWAQVYFSFDTRISGIMLGAIVALAGLKVSRHAAKIACLCLAMAIAVPTLPSLPAPRHIEAVTLMITLGELSAFLLVAYVAQHGNARILASRPLVYVGRLSYGIYLWHFPVYVLLRATLPGWLLLIVTLGVACTLAALCLHLVDMPIRRFRNATWPTRRPATQGLS